ncbi:zinc finger protein 596-like [Trichogramma pretiosum]|uniref:zinc finger protein 596-like n=1 Tax=Trichogramma pretiosum TaxID=7493 RepID=UPI000C71A9CB|nr:zinc finger protein 596-like [Trichogramma pretiosum]
MESGDLFDPAITVKEEPRHELLDNNVYDIIDTTLAVPQNVKYEKSWHENSTQELLQEYDENHENELDDIQIELECTDTKPNLLAVSKIEDFSPNQFQDSNDYKTESKIKLETFGTVKKEIFSEEATVIKVECVSKSMNCKHSLETQIDTAHNGITPASHLKRHVDAVRKDVTHACEICGNVFKRTVDLNRHIDSVHNSVRHACDICGKTYSDKSNLKRHIDSMHNCVSHECNICGNVIKHKGDLKRHIDSVHNQVRQACDKCPKTFSVKSNLKKHIDAVHNEITQACDFCEKKFKYQTQLNRHVKSSHNDITYKCKICGKTFGQKRNLKAHIDVAH